VARHVRRLRRGALDGGAADRHSGVSEGDPMKKHVLVVDDSPTDRQMVTTLLQKEGYAVTTAIDGEDALQKIAAEQPPLVVLDIVLPKMNGYQVLRQLKSAPETRNIKVILVSSKNQEADRFWGLKQGADDYIAKPIPDAALLTAIARHF
jgi:twitching motility two-component system response regulator PilH